MGAQFKIIVVGGGLAGLATALFLRRHGHKITVIDSIRQLSEVGAGIQVPPNSTRILYAYGLGPRFEDVVVKPSHINLRRYANGHVLGKTPLVPEMMDTFGFPYWVIHRADYLNLLHDAVVEAGVEIRLSSRVECVDSDSVSLELEDGTTLSADLIIGADGIRSKVRSSILGDEDVQAIPSPNCAYRAILPREVMMSDPTTAELMTSPNSNGWIGPGRHIMAYPIRGASQYNVVCSAPGKAEVGVWNQPGDLDEMNKTYENFDPLIRRVLGYITTAMKWTLADTPPLPRWRSHNGRVVLIGDAAHAMLPYVSQGAAQGIEDAAVLAECLDRAGHTDDLRRLIEIFEVIRKERAEIIQARARVNGTIWHAEDGEEQERRDRAMLGELTAEEMREDEMNPNVFADKNFQPWLMGHDAIKDANERLDDMLRERQPRQSQL